jgi:hypothetical protein
VLGAAKVPAAQSATKIKNFILLKFSSETIKIDVFSKTAVAILWLVLFRNSVYISK